MNYQFLPIVISMLTLGLSSMATIGTAEEVARDARKNSDPEYIGLMMEKLSEKILVFATEEKIASPKEELALLVSGYIFLSFAQGAAMDAVEWVSGKDYHWRKETREFKNISPMMLTRRALFWALELDKKALALVKAAYSANNFFSPHSFHEQARAYFFEETNARVAYRIAEWASLNFLFDRFDEFDSEEYENCLIKTLYRAALENFSPHSFHDVDWQNLKTALLNGHSEEAKIFLKPWLITSDRRPVYRY